MDIKSIFASRTFWGAVITFAAMVLTGVFGFEVTELEQGDLLNWIVGVGGGFGTLLTIYGRWRARSKVSVTGS